MTPFLSNILLALAWVALSGHYTAGNLFFGFLIGFSVIWIAHRGSGISGYPARLRAVAWFVIFFIKELILANLRVAHDVLTPSHHMNPGIVAVPLDLKTDMQITLLATLITLTPGTLSLHITRDRRTLYVHAMYIDDPHKLVLGIKQGFEQRVKEVFQ